MVNFPSVLVNNSRRCFPLERYFVAVVLFSGLVVFMIASSLIDQSQYDGRQYLYSKREAADISYRKSDSHREEKMGFINSFINMLSKSAIFQQDVDNKEDSINEDSVATLDVSSLTTRPITDPPWLANTTHPFSSSSVRVAWDTNLTHPFLQGNVIESPDVCKNVDVVDLLIVIHSAVKNFQRRRVLRETWAGLDVLHGITVRRVFLLGRDSSAEEETQLRVNTEAAVYGDIVQGDFADTYTNLTLKAVTSLRWVHHHCRQARFVLKSDDDMFVNVFLLAEHFLQLIANQTRAVLCHAKAADSSVIVRSKGRWYVEPSLFPGLKNWPAFCSGYVIAMTSDVIPRLYKASFYVPYVPVDDAFLYGILPQVASQIDEGTLDTNNRNRINKDNKTDTYSDVQLDFNRVFLNVTDLSKNLTLSASSLLAQYSEANMPVTFVAGQVSNDATMIQMWSALMNRLSPWAQFKSSLTRLQSKMAPKIL